ncbi:hypothetical protein R3P38DRAFT_3365947 [Favolaschia claudopus]|uniref:DUF6534 domain-containing protein n=1 Tax=Favolaschia claudopus TaxID=2862362 RepID=A0AAW0AEJ1_9AGAR
MILKFVKRLSGRSTKDMDGDVIAPCYKYYDDRQAIYNLATLFAHLFVLRKSIDMESHVQFDAPSNIGAYQIGVLISFVLLGVTITQAYVYYSRFPDDSWKLKSLVAFVCICEFSQAVCISHTLYKYTVVDYQNPDQIMGRPPKSLDAAVFFARLIEECVQGFFAYRIFRISNRLLIPAAIWVLASLRLILSCVVFGIALRLSSFHSYYEHWGSFSLFLWSAGAGNDIFTTVVLLHVLYSHRRAIGQKRTVALVDKLIIWSIETGLLTSATQILLLILFITKKATIELFIVIWLAVFIVTSRPDPEQCTQIRFLQVPETDFGVCKFEFPRDLTHHEWTRSFKPGRCFAVAS